MDFKVTGIPLFVLDPTLWTLNVVPNSHDTGVLVGVQCDICHWVEWWDEEDEPLRDEPTLRDLLVLAQSHEHKEGARG